MALKGWSDSVGRSWGDGKDIAKRAKTVEADIKRLTRAIDKMDKPTLEKLLKERRKELVSVSKQHDDISKARVGYYKYGEATVKNEKAAAKKKADEYMDRIFQPINDAYSTAKEEMESCINASFNLHWHQKELVNLIEAEIKKRK